MRYSQTIFKTLRQAPKEAETINHKLLVQAGFVRQLMAGVYTYLPLGHRVLDKISNIIRQEMNAIGGQEVLMPMLHPAENWKKTGGWESIDVLFKLQSRSKKDYALSQSHEEVVTPLAKEFINSAKDLPLSIYHIQWKFRDELRSKSGIMRGREFLMKDMYSWHLTQEDFDNYYAKAKEAYLKVYKRLGLDAKVTEASGGAFTEKISYEFEVLTEAGEANIMYCDKCDYCVNTDDIQKNICPNCGVELKASKAAEVGNVFDLGQKYSKAFDLKIDGVYPIMGCYGIGISRTMGVIVEKFHDDRGIIWPKEISPFQVHLISIKNNDLGSKIYDLLSKANIEVLWDDTEKSAGEKFANADLIGIPVRLVVSEKTGEKIEYKERNSDKTELLDIKEVVSRLGSVK